MLRVLIKAELARGHRWNRNFNQNFCPGRDLNPKPHDWQSSALTIRPPHTKCRINLLGGPCCTRCFLNVVFTETMSARLLFGQSVKAAVVGCCYDQLTPRDIAKTDRTDDHHDHQPVTQN